MGQLRPRKGKQLAQGCTANGRPIESSKAVILNLCQLKNASKGRKCGNLLGHMGGTLWRKIICCWSILRAKTVSFPVQSLCSWIQNIVNAFGVDYKEDTDLAVAGRAQSVTGDIPRVQPETQQRPSKDTNRL